MLSTILNPGNYKDLIAIFKRYCSVELLFFSHRCPYSPWSAGTFIINILYYTKRRKTWCLLIGFISSHPDCQWCSGAGWGRPLCWRCWRRHTKRVKIAGHSLAGCPGWGGLYRSVRALTRPHRRHQHPSVPADMRGTPQCDSKSGPCVLSVRVQSNIHLSDSYDTNSAS